MNCANVRPLLMGFVYGELSAEEEERLREHLAECGDCRRQAEELHASLELLESVPRTETRVDVRRLYRQAAAHSERSRRRWRRGALAACAAALLVTVVASGRLRIECHADSLVLSWGNPAATHREGEPDAAENPSENRLPSPRLRGEGPGLRSLGVGEGDSRIFPAGKSGQSPSFSPPDPWPTLRRHEERLATLDELAQLLVAELDSTDRRRSLDLVAFQRRLEELERQNASRWATLDRDFRAVYQLAQNQPTTNEKGAQP